MTFRINIIIPALLLFAMLSACKQNIAMETTVYPDGSLDKVIHLGSDRDGNILGLRAEDGWDVTSRIVPEADSTKIYTFRRHFSSAAEANAVLASPSDSLFRITSTFEKKFRWFYTYLYYADTYHAIKRLKYPIDTYITPEDYAFIDRLPAEGKKISPADSLYLVHLQDKIFEEYGLRAMYEGYYDIIVTLMQESHVEHKWFDTLRSHKESIFRDIGDRRDIDEDYLLHTIDSIGIPIASAKKSTLYTPLVESMNYKLAFMSFASGATYRHQINMPWAVVRTNADSISGNQLIWNPPSIKFLLKDHTFYAESRQLNYWAVAISAGVMALTIFLFVRKRKTSL